MLDSGLTNRSLLLELVSDSVFRDGPVTTRWLDRHVASRPGSEARSHLEAALAAAVLGDYLQLRRGHIANFIEEAQRVVPHTVPEPGPTKIRFVLGTHPLEVEVGSLGPQELRMRCGDWQAVVQAQATGKGTLLLDYGGRRYAVQRRRDRHPRCMSRSRASPTASAGCRTGACAPNCRHRWRRFTCSRAIA